MRLLGYTRTRLLEDVGEADLQQQERALAEFCSSHQHELIGVVADEGSGPQSALSAALNSDAEGIVITDSMVIGETLDAAVAFAGEMVSHKKHLFIMLHDKHIDPTVHPAEDLIHQQLSLLNHEIT